jgi:serine/threonine-protein kinase
MPTLHDQLQRTLGDAYRLDRELGGGGMSKVFVAEEAALGRRVVVKVSVGGAGGRYQLGTIPP